MPTKTESRRNKELLPVSVIKERFIYSPDTGEVIRLPGQVDVNGRRVNKGVGKTVTSKCPSGYLRTTIVYAGKQFDVKAHHVAWILSHGAWPDKVIDHINGMKDDNRICNLREVEFRENAANRHVDGIGITEKKNITGGSRFIVTCCYSDTKLRGICRTRERAQEIRAWFESLLFPNHIKNAA